MNVPVPVLIVFDTLKGKHPLIWVKPFYIIE